MTPEWLEDGRKVPDDVMYSIRRMAVYAVRVLGQSPEKVAEAYHFDRSCIYRWLKQYDGGGFEALESHMPGGYDTHLWTCPILATLLQDKFGVTVSDTAVRQHLKAMGLTCQKPEYQDVARDEGEIARFLDDKFPRIQRLAEKREADIAFEDEAGLGVMTRHGRTWGMSGETPVIKASMLRGGYNVLSAVTAEGEMDYSIQDGTVNGERYIGFLGGLIADRKRPLIVLADHATFHHSKQVRDYVRAHRSQLRVFFLPK